MVNKIYSDEFSNLELIKSGEDVLVNINTKDNFIGFSIKLNRDDIRELIKDLQLHLVFEKDYKKEAYQQAKSKIELQKAMEEAFADIYVIGEDGRATIKPL